MGKPQDSENQCKNDGQQSLDMIPRTLNIPNCHCHRPKGRKLIVALDGTSNQFGRKNTNVIELYARIEKSDDQRTYYNSGIGTYAKPSWRSFSYWKTVIENKIDLAFAWNFDKIVMGAYRWLSENYQEGDQIFLFGFSRGAYQVRVLAGMIETVGLIHPGNEEQIPFAYELYADSATESNKINDNATGNKPTVELHKTSMSHGPTSTIIQLFAKKAWSWVMLAFTWVALSCSYILQKGGRYVNPMLSNLQKDTYDNPNMVQHFKETFSRPSVKVHFVGVWDTVSSVGIGRSRALPLVHSHEHICFFRHALALDECRVKFLPEYIHGGESVHQRDMEGQGDGPRATYTPAQSMYSADIAGKVKEGRRDKVIGQPRVKEVWFAGSHADIGGRIKISDKLDVGDVPSLWMANEAMVAGLKLKPSKVEWDWNELEKAAPSKSLTRVWQLIEWLPFKRLTYKNASGTTRDIHMGQGRIIKPGQLIHASVAFKRWDMYRPKAMFAPEMKGKSWEAIIGSGGIDDISWGSDLTDILEMDLFDLSQAGSLIERLKMRDDVGSAQNALKRLSRLALYDAGTKSIVMADEGCQTLIEMLERISPELQSISGVLLYRLAGHFSGIVALRQAHIPQVIARLMVKPKYKSVRAVAIGILARLDPGKEFHDLNMRHLMGGVRAGILKAHPMEWIMDSLQGAEPEIQACVAEGLVWLARDEVPSDIRAAILETNIVKSVAALLNSQNGNVQSSGAEALWTLARYRGVGAAISETDATASLAVMLNSPDAKVRSSGAQALSNLAKYGVIRASILETDAITSLASMLESEAVRVKMSGAIALADLGRYGDFSEAISQTRPIGSLTKMLKSQDSLLQMSAAECMVRLAEYDVFKASIADTEVLVSLAGMLKSREHAVPFSGADALAKLAEHREIRPKIAETDAIALLAEMLKSQNEKVQFSGARVLAALSQHGDLRAAIARTCLTVSLVAMLKSQVYILKSLAAKVLLNMAEHSEIRAATSKTDAIRSFAAMLKDDDHEVQISGAEALSAFVDGDESLAALLEMGTLGSLTAMISSQNATLTFAGVDALVKLAEHSDIRAAIVVTSTFDFRLLTRMLWDENILMIFSGAIALAALSQHSELRVEIVQTNPTDSVAHMLKSQDGLVLSLGAEILVKLSEHDGIRASIIQTDAMASLALMLESQDPIIQISGSDALARLAAYEEIRTAIINTNAINSLATMLKSQEEEVQASGAEALATLAQYGEFLPLIKTTGTLNLVKALLKNEGLAQCAHLVVLLLALLKHDHVRGAAVDPRAIDWITVTSTESEKDKESILEEMESTSQVGVYAHGLGVPKRRSFRCWRSDPVWVMLVI